MVLCNAGIGGQKASEGDCVSRRPEGISGASSVASIMVGTNCRPCWAQKSFALVSATRSAFAMVDSRLVNGQDGALPLPIRRYQVWT